MEMILRRAAAPLTLTEASAVVDAALARSRERDVNVSVAVVDARGDLVALMRMDEARFHTPDIAHGKASVAAIFGLSTGQLANLPSGTDAQAVFDSLNLMNQGRLCFTQGAVPLTRDGTLLGAVGVAGASNALDEEIAVAGGAAIS